MDVELRALLEQGDAFGRHGVADENLHSVETGAQRNRCVRAADCKERKGWGQTLFRGLGKGEKRRGGRVLIEGG
jgi:hypothetical protein